MKLSELWNCNRNTAQLQQIRFAVCILHFQFPILALASVNPPFFPKATQAPFLAFWLFAPSSIAFGIYGQSILADRTTR